ncbi:hypothetical protein UA18_01363 [Burkholderia multivorans]|uniref:Uncharacterized protein n=1 Tax=Burkholderia multivorans TaxID=87883 RepID=A0ABD7LHQ2_9BURK|nr:hypothetical protein [Burkholderia multivorans]SAK15756.1 hypothetical protein UA18_01363 [Burkholderia multivorans]
MSAHSCELAPRQSTLLCINSALGTNVVEQSLKSNDCLVWHTLAHPALYSRDCGLADPDTFSDVHLREAEREQFGNY